MPYKVCITSILIIFSFLFCSSLYASSDVAPIQCVAEDGCVLVANTPQELQNEQLVQRFYDDVFNQGNFSKVGTYLSKTIVYNGEYKGLSGQIKGLQAFTRSFSSLHNKILFVMAKGDFVVIRQVWDGIQVGPYMGISATNQPVEWTSNTILQIKNNFIQRMWSVEDNLTLLQQIGAYPSMCTGNKLTSEKA